MTTIIDKPFTAGEIPDPLEWTFKDGAGTVIDLTGYSGSFTFVGDSTTTRASTVDAEEGKATHVWQDGDLTATTRTVFYEGEFTVTNGSNTFISDRIRWAVRPAL